MIDGKYIRMKVDVTINNVNVVLMFANRSCVCCRSSVRCVSQSNVEGRRVDEIDKARSDGFGGSIAETVDKERGVLFM